MNITSTVLHAQVFIVSHPKLRQICFYTMLICGENIKGAIYSKWKI